MDGADHSSSRRVMLAMGVLYVGFGVLAALLQGGLPPVLRARGLSVAQIGWTFALYLPIGLSFLWAPLGPLSFRVESNTVTGASPARTDWPAGA